MTKQTAERTNAKAIADLLLEIAIRVAYIEQLNPAVNEDETFACARALVKALRSGVSPQEPRS